MLLKIWLAVFPAVIYASPTTAALEPIITPAPHLEARDENPQLVGYFYESDLQGYTPDYCPTTATWSQAGAYGRCCNTALQLCDMIVGCTSGSVVVGLSTSVTCTSTAPACIVDYVLESIGDTSTISWIGCDTARQAETLYRNSPSSSVASTSPASTPASTTITVPNPGPTSPTPNPAPTHSSGSKAWIAGAAVGGAAGIALIAGLIFWLIYRRKRSSQLSDASPSSQQPMTFQPPPPSSPPEKSHFYPVYSPGSHMSEPGAEMGMHRPMSQLPQYASESAAHEYGGKNVVYGQGASIAVSPIAPRPRPTSYEVRQPPAGIAEIGY